MLPLSWAKAADREKIAPTRIIERFQVTKHLRCCVSALRNTALHFKANVGKNTTYPELGQALLVVALSSHCNRLLVDSACLEAFSNSGDKLEQIGRPRASAEDKGCLFDDRMADRTREV